MKSNRDNRLAAMSSTSTYRTHAVSYGFPASTTNSPVVKTRDTSTQTITKGKNLDPINYARLYIHAENGHDIRTKRSQFYENDRVNENIRKRYYEYIQDHEGYDNWTKLTKVHRKYHLLDRTLSTNILHISPKQLKDQFFGVGWDYLGLQARMEYQKEYYPELSDDQIDPLFFKDLNVSTNLKFGYKRWKSNNMVTGTSSTFCVILQNDHSSGDLIELDTILPDPTLGSNTCKMSIDEIQAKYPDETLLGLQARMEFAKDKNELKNENLHLIDLDFILTQEIPHRIRAAYRKWLASNSLRKIDHKFYVKKLEM